MCYLCLIQICVNSLEGKIKSKVTYKPNFPYIIQFKAVETQITKDKKVKNEVQCFGELKLTESLYNELNLVRSKLEKYFRC